jgi:4-amino-4-deoxy-L-arabinose transferase-like glycosyltransferase
VIPTDNHSTPPSTLVRVVWLILITTTLYLCYFHNLGAIGLVGPDEPRYAWVAREMVESGDWVTPRLCGKSWFEKPVLYYWGAAASFKLFGVSETAARLPSAICALLATLSMAWLARKLYGVKTARWLLLFLPTTVGMIGFSHAASMDMPLTGMLTIAMVLACVIVGLTRDDNSPVIPQTPWIALLFFGFFLGLAVLAKGPVAIILSAGPIFLWAAFTKRWREAVRCLHPVAIASFCLTALPWYILCARRNPYFFRIFIIEHNFRRFLTPEFQHVQPFWFYIPVVFIAFLPWALVLFSSAFFGCVRLARGKKFSAPSLFLLCWALFCLLFFSISKSKLPGYILPAIPALSLLMATSYVQRTARESKIFRWIQFGGGFLALVLAALVPWTAVKPALSAGLIIFALGIANILLAVHRRTNPFSTRLAYFSLAPVLLLLCFFNRLESAFLPVDPSGKTLAAEIILKQIPLEQIYTANMNRGQRYSLNFYLHHETQQWNPKDQKEGYLLLKSKNCRQIVEQPMICADEPAQTNPSGWFIYTVRQQD